MAYIGSTPTSQNFTSGTDYFSGTGSQTAFTLTRTVNSVNDIEVVINNVVQQPSTAYTLSGTTVTFTSAPSSGTNNIYVRYLATNMQSFTVSANSIDKSKLSSDLQAGFQGRNKIINGHMVVDQRNAGASVTPTGPASAYTLDRWQTYASVSSKYTIQQNAGSVTPPAGFTKYLGVTSTSAYTVGSAETFSLRQYIEGYNVADLCFGSADAKTITISFWVRSSLTGSFGGVFWDGTAGTSFYPFGYTISVANTWQQVSITLAGRTSGTWATNNTAGACVQFSIGTGSTFLGTANTWSSSTILAPTGSTNIVGTSGATFYITGVQLEEGTTATSFEREIYSTTLQKCQRYYTVLANGATHLNSYWSNAYYYGTTAVWGTLHLPVTMRTTPTTACTTGTNYYTMYASGAADGFNSITVSYSNPQAITWTNNAQVSGTSGQAGGVDVTTSSSFIAVTAEL